MAAKPAGDVFLRSVVLEGMLDDACAQIPGDGGCLVRRAGIHNQAFIGDGATALQGIGNTVCFVEGDDGNGNLHPTRLPNASRLVNVDSSPGIVSVSTLAYTLG